MRARALVLGVAAIVLAGCGGSSSSSKSSTSAHHTAAPRVTYHLTLTGAAETPRGAPTGGGAAVISVHGTTKICWRFAHLHGFTHPTFAHIHVGPAGKSGNIVVPLSTGSKFKHKGCVHASSTVVKPILANPGGYYVNIHSNQYPAGAVRSQL